MREIELASWLGISRTPTRHALSRLEIEGLLEVRPRTGLVVSSLDETAMEELYEMRAVLEGAAAAMAAHHASPREVAALEQLIKEEARLPIRSDCALPAQPRLSIGPSTLPPTIVFS